MYEFLTGPMLWAAFLIFVIGLARRVYPGVGLAA